MKIPHHPPESPKSLTPPLHEKGTDQQVQVKVMQTQPAIYASPLG